MNTIMAKALQKFIELKLGQVEKISFVDTYFENGKCVSGVVEIHYFDNDDLCASIMIYVPRAIKEKARIL